MVTRIRSSKPHRLFIAEWRKKQGDLTQQTLADRIGTTKGTISRWENGERDPPVAAVYAIAEALGIAAGDLFNDPARPSPADLFKGVSAEELSQALRVVEALRKTGS
jgi:transcriptional regulator with XRE-family HTH domain